MARLLRFEGAETAADRLRAVKNQNHSLANKLQLLALLYPAGFQAILQFVDCMLKDGSPGSGA